MMVLTAEFSAFCVRLWPPWGQSLACLAHWHTNALITSYCVERINKVSRKWVENRMLYVIRNMCVYWCGELVFRRKLWGTARMCWGFLSCVLKTGGQGDFCTAWQGMLIYHYDSHTFFQRQRFSMAISKGILGDQCKNFGGEREWMKGRQKVVKERTGQTTQFLSTGIHIIKMKTITHIHRADQHIFSQNEGNAQLLRGSDINISADSTSRTKKVK